ncbi:uncharacterized protein LOC120010192 isoform X2 [Tripterygium wilfordii]|nr:uncharacterized protein LOC120010192 isoform X2 [Tripterygium wilfordii]
MTSNERSVFGVKKEYYYRLPNWCLVLLTNFAGNERSKCVFFCIFYVRSSVPKNAEKEREDMSKQPLMIDAWIREAQNAENLVEDLERRVENKNPLQEHCLLGFTAQSKLLAAGVILDRLESLLRNPPSKPILSDEDLKYRWQMLSDMQLRTRSLALSLYSVSSLNRAACLAAKDPDGTIKSQDKDQIRDSFSKDDPELLNPLISEDAAQSEEQTKQSGSCMTMGLLGKTCQIIGLILGAAALVFILVTLCAIL